MADRLSPEEQFGLWLAQVARFNTYPETKEQLVDVIGDIREMNKRQGRNILSDLAHYDVLGQYMAMEPEDGHGPDTWKKPFHPSFSVESKYSRPGREGGTWSGPEQEQIFTPSEWMRDRIPSILDYYRWANSQPGEPRTQIRDPKTGEILGP